MTEIVCADVMDWARDYDGPKFHALLCDPPYHLTNRTPDVKRCVDCKRVLGGRDGHPATCPRCGGKLENQRSQGGRGFMGKKWDGGDIAYRPETWAALAKHLHPGAFGMAFASARGWHRLAVAIEDAGLVIHPSIFQWTAEDGARHWGYVDGEVEQMLMGHPDLIRVPGMLGWSYGSGFPKATRIDTQVDKAAGAEREGTGEYHKRNVKPYDDSSGWNANNTVGNHEYTTPATPLAQAWEGHRYSLQALKPALEPIIVFQKPYQGKPVECITETGAGALWVDGGRIGTNGRVQSSASEGVPFRCNYEKGTGRKYQNAGRWPANFCLVHHPECRRVGERRVRGAGWRDTDNQQGDSAFGIGNTQGREYGQHYADPDGLETIAAWECHESCPARRLGEQSGESGPGKWMRTDGARPFNNDGKPTNATEWQRLQDTGTAARFFFQAAWNLEHADPVMYCAKASRKERDAGLEGMAQGKNVERYGQRGKCVDCGRWQEAGEGVCTCGGAYERQSNQHKGDARNPHPTVKPIALAQWLATLLLPPEEYAPRRILIPFAGSGSEGIGAGLAGWDEMTLIEMDPETCAIAEARLAHWLSEPRQLELQGA